MKNFFNSELITSHLYQTPYFIFSRERIVRKYKEFKECFPSADIHYAMKANSELEVLLTLHKAGCGFEVASLYELNMLKKINVCHEKILYGTSVKPESHIKEFFEYGVDRFVFDSYSELEKIARLAKGSKVFLRVRVNDNASVFKFSEKFGTEIENIIPMLSKAKSLGLIPYGISFHVGSQSTDSAAWALALKSLASTMKELEELQITLQAINLGGGFPCNYPSCDKKIGVEEIAEKLFVEYNKLPYQPKIIIEPGRGIIAETGILIVSVIACVERNESTWLFLDAGVYNGLFEAMSYQGSTRYHVSLLRKSSNEQKHFALAGPTGDSPDVITREILLPSDTRVGDKLIFHDVGAYSISVTSEFNGFPKPAVYFI